VKPTNPKGALGVRKVPASAIPAPVLAELALALLEGACKYGRHNYRTAGARASVYYDAALRHLWAWWEGEDIDPDSGLSHVTKAIAGLVVLRDAMARGNWTDDRPPRCEEGWVQRLNEQVAAILDRYPEPKPAFVERDTERPPAPESAEEWAWNADTPPPVELPPDLRWDYDGGFDSWYVRTDDWLSAFPHYVSRDSVGQFWMFYRAGYDEGSQRIACFSTALDACRALAGALAPAEEWVWSHIIPPPVKLPSGRWWQYDEDFDNWHVKVGKWIQTSLGYVSRDSDGGFWALLHGGREATATSVSSFADPLSACRDLVSALK
jgi:hypothetical protein